MRLDGGGGGGGGVDVSECADWSTVGHDDVRGLSGGRARWWVRCRFPWVCRELWKDLSDSLQFFFDIRRDVFPVSLERRSGEYDLRC